MNSRGSTTETMFPTGSYVCNKCGKESDRPTELSLNGPRNGGPSYPCKCGGQFIDRHKRGDDDGRD